ncbi:hypothetical protein HK104_009009 [Borealophlyctis nickersoniae]|nr:hypothetical protein HK104_009009 [Borealophlyctis nickersoniae]
MTTPRKGALVICGSTAWDFIGRGKRDASQEYPGPHVFGPMKTVNVAAAFTHCTAAHSVVVDDEGNAYTFGRNERGQLGDDAQKSRNDPHKVVIAEAKGDKFIKAAVGRGHTILLTESGKLFGAGDNRNQQIGNANRKDHTQFTVVADFRGRKVVDVACGGEFTLAVTVEGQVWSFGSPQYGQLGHGTNEETIAKANRITYEPQLPRQIMRLKDCKIVSVAAGTNHCLALDDTGGIYTWGMGGFGRLGLGHATDTMFPTEVPGFKDRNNSVTTIACGPACSMVIDGKDAVYLWGKWKNSGDGGDGQPWLRPRLFDGLMGWKIEGISLGGSALFAFSGTTTISWGQACQNGELGYGENKPRSSTVTAEVGALKGINTFGVACGAGHTLLIVDRENPNFSKLPVSTVPPSWVVKKGPETALSANRRRRMTFYFATVATQRFTYRVRD